MIEDKFVRGYVAGALWSSTTENGTALDEMCDEDDLAPETLAAMASDCEDFQESNKEGLAEAYACESSNYGKDKEFSAGFDFWITRNGHGAGFWDRGLGEIGDDLTAAAKVYSSIDLYVGDDGKVYQQ